MWTLVLYDAQGSELRRLPLGGEPLTIGRSRDCALTLDAKAVSRRHAQIQAQGASVILADLGSANGTLLNGRRLQAAAPLGAGDTVRIGDFSLRLEAAPAAETPPVRRTEPPPEAPQIRVPSQPDTPAAPAAVAPAGGWSSASELLEQRLHSIRSFRGEAQKEPAQKLDAFEQAWDQVVGSMRELQQRLQGDARVPLFSISRNQREISAKIVDAGSRRGHVYLILSPEHPEGKYRGQLTVWLREFGEADVSYDDPHEAMRHFVDRIARKLA